MGQGSPRLLVIFTAATALVVGLIAALATDNWIFLPVAIAIHAIGTVFVLMAIAPRLKDEDKPDPVTEARLEEERAG
jgi:membrane protein implicated in regulation of membrane protease activity